MARAGLAGCHGHWPGRRRRRTKKTKTKKEKKEEWRSAAQSTTGKVTVLRPAVVMRVKLQSDQIMSS
jgi:hypothetical protein